ncbi:MAG: oligosaccharide flippase family protein [Thermodesulfobacteriota bacterium]
MSTSRIRANTVANYAGTFWASLMSLIFVPLYIHFMGIESYGLVGIFASLQALFGILDLGLSATMNREMARLAARPESRQDARDLARTLETVYWAVAVLLGAATLLLAGPVTDYWVKPDRLPRETVQQALTIVAFVVALRWPVSFYTGGLMGLQRQVPLNVIFSVTSTLRGAGAVGVLWLVSPTIQAFFVFQIFCSAIEVATLTICLWRFLPPSEKRPRFRVERLKEVWRFSAGMTGITVVVIILLQTDKVILSKMLTLEQFGYYTLAWNVAAVMTRAIAPVCAAVYPRLTELATRNDEPGFAALYHKTSQIVAVLTFPLAATIVFFSHEIIFLWSHSERLASNTAPIVSILAVGTCFNMIMHTPYYAQLAHGWTSLAFFQNVASVVVLVPLMILLTLHYGTSGAALVWVILNAGYLSIAVNVMHQRILKHERLTWYVRDVALPAMAVLAIAVPAALFMPTPLSVSVHVAYVLVIAGLCFAAAALVTSHTRDLLLDLARGGVRGFRVV